MPGAMATVLKLVACAGVAAAAMTLVAPARAVSAPIYKCFDNHLSLVYTDLPCKDGEVVDIRAGDADPAAVARLEQQRNELDQSAAQRMLDERRAALTAGYGAWMPPEPSQPESVPTAYGYGYYGSGSFWYPPLRHPPLRHPRPNKSHAGRGSVPATPRLPKS